jgi:hypothetical protein
LTAVAVDGFPATDCNQVLVNRLLYPPFTNESPNRTAIYEALMLNATRRSGKGMRKQFE